MDEKKRKAEMQADEASDKQVQYDCTSNNMSIRMHANSQLLITSLYDFETECVVSANLSDPLLAFFVDQLIDENAAPSITRVPQNAA